MADLSTTIDDPSISARTDDDLPEELRNLLTYLEANPGTTRLRLEAEIGRGGMGRVHLAKDDALRRHSALKVLAPRAGINGARMAAFLREAQIMAQLDHPNIVPIHDVGVDEAGTLHISMKLMEGRTFRDWIGLFPERPYQTSELIEIIEVITKICDALAFAHSRGVVHCDVTPRNVMVGDFGATHLMDWGIARSGVTRSVSAPEQEVVTTTSSSQIPRKAIGTPAFMSPEHVGAGLIDERTDVFQIGALLYFALTRRPPNPNCRPDALVGHVIAGDFGTPSEVAPWAKVPPALEAIVMKAMATRPVDRYDNAMELRAALTRFMWGGEAFDRVNFREGEHIIHEGDMGDCAYIIASGSVQVYRTMRGERINLRVMVEGEVFGEMAVLTERVRSASVVAATDCSLYIVDRAAIENELVGAKPWMGALTRALAIRLKEREDDYLESTMD